MRIRSSGPVADGIYAACGFSGHGFMQAPAVGRIVADVLIDGGVDFDLSVSARALRGREPVSRDRDPVTRSARPAEVGRGSRVSAGLAGGAVDLAHRRQPSEQRHSCSSSSGRQMIAISSWHVRSFVAAAASSSSSPFSVSTA